MIRIITFAATIAAIAPANAEVDYREEPAEFSSGKKRTLLVSTMKPSPAAVFLICKPDDGLSVQFYSKRTILPDSVRNKKMLLSVTHRFDNAPEPEQSAWTMNMMRYHNAWYEGEPKKFASGLKTSNTLAVKLDKTGDVYRFGLSGTSGPVDKVLSGCPD